MTSPRLSLEHKRRAFHTLITPAALYGAELWSLRQSDKRKLRTAQLKMERKLLGISLLHRWSNQHIRDTTKVVDWVQLAERKKIDWANRVRQMDESRWTKILTTWVPYSHKRSQGNPRTRWRDSLQFTIGKDWWSISPEEYISRRDQHATLHPSHDSDK